MWPSNSAPGYISTPQPKIRNPENRCLNKNLHINIQSNIHSSQKVKTTQMSISRWTDKQILVHNIIEYFSVLKRNEVQIHTATWMNLENIMLSKISQTQRPHIVWFHLYEIYKIGKFMEGTRVWEEEGVGNDCLMSKEFPFRVIKMFWN